MKQYIDKSALVAEIEKRKGMCDNHYGEYWNGCYNTMEDIISFLDTLKVKEVDLEKEIKLWFDYGLPNNEELLDYIKETAEHFFEFGLKAKGE